MNSHIGIDNLNNIRDNDKTHSKFVNETLTL